MNELRLNGPVVEEYLHTINHLFIDIARLTYEQGYEEIVGGYCELKIATLDPGIPAAKLVAAKRLRLGVRVTDPKRLAFRLARELKVWAGLRHPHVLPLLGFYLDNNYKTAVLISEYMNHGDLKHYISTMKPPSNERLHLVRDLTDGLTYLHSQQAPIRHGDLKPGNVLVNSDRRALLADFGLSRALDTGPTGFTTGNDARGTIRYSSPEVLLGGTEAVSLANDIWSWGCLVFEALTDKIPFANIQPEPQLILALVQGKSPNDTNNPSAFPQQLGDLLAKCWSREPDQRPTVVDCLHIIELTVPGLEIRRSLRFTELAGTSNHHTQMLPPLGRTHHSLDRYKSHPPPPQRPGYPAAQPAPHTGGGSSSHPLSNRHLPPLSSQHSPGPPHKQDNSLPPLLPYNQGSSYPPPLSRQPNQHQALPHPQPQPPSHYPPPPSSHAYWSPYMNSRPYPSALLQYPSHPHRPEHQRSDSFSSKLNRAPLSRHPSASERGSTGPPSRVFTSDQVMVARAEETASAPLSTTSPQTATGWAHPARREATIQERFSGGAPSNCVPALTAGPSLAANPMDNTELLESRGGSRLLIRKEPFTPAWATPPHVLLVDDDQANRKLFSKLLQVSGCKVDVAVDGIGAVNKMNLEKYDLVLMDIVMPKLGGASATSRIRQFDHMTPIIAMTSLSEPDDVARYYSRGMNDILPKPFTQESLFTMLEKHLMHLKAITTARPVAEEPSKMLSEDQYPSILDLLGMGTDGMNGFPLMDPTAGIVMSDPAASGKSALEAANNDTAGNPSRLKGVFDPQTDPTSRAIAFDRVTASRVEESAAAAGTSASASATVVPSPSTERTYPAGQETTIQEVSSEPGPSNFVPVPAAGPSLVANPTDNTGLSESPRGSRLRIRKRAFTPAWAVPPRVLLVDDYQVNRKLFSTFLQVSGCKVDVAVDGIDAMKKMNLEKYDLVLMDVVMPSLGGASATSLIRQFDQITPIIAMTSLCKPDDVVTYYSSGMNDILPKPFTRESLFTMLEKHLMHLKATTMARPDAEEPSKMLSEDHYYSSMLNLLGMGPDGMNGSPPLDPTAGIVTSGPAASGKRAREAVDDNRENKRSRFEVVE